jgi:hypothetical protein
MINRRAWTRLVPGAKFASILGVGFKGRVAATHLMEELELDDLWKRKDARWASRRKSEANMAKRKAAQKRELINTASDKRYVRRGMSGRFKESDDVGRSLAKDRRRKAKTKARRGQGDREDR